MIVGVITGGHLGWKGAANQQTGSCCHYTAWVAYLFVAITPSAVCQRDTVRGFSSTKLCSLSGNQTGLDTAFETCGGQFGDMTYRKELIYSSFDRENVLISGMTKQKTVAVSSM